MTGCSAMDLCFPGWHNVERFLALLKDVRRRAGGDARLRLPHCAPGDREGGAGCAVSPGFRRLPAAAYDGRWRGRLPGVGARDLERDRALWSRARAARSTRLERR